MSGWLTFRHAQGQKHVLPAESEPEPGIQGRRRRSRSKCRQPQVWSEQYSLWPSWRVSRVRCLSFRHAHHALGGRRTPVTRVTVESLGLPPRHTVADPSVRPDQSVVETEHKTSASPPTADVRTDRANRPLRANNGSRSGV